jgi:hypothetical protein
MLAWFVPVIVGVVAINRLNAHYRAKFAPRRKEPLPHPETIPA